jgi:hypothetical protein
VSACTVMWSDGLAVVLLLSAVLRGECVLVFISKGGRNVRLNYPYKKSSHGV